jgi:hypothetical protein
MLVAGRLLYIETPLCCRKQMRVGVQIVSHILPAARSYAGEAEKLGHAA